MRLADMAKEDGKGRRDVFWLNPDRLTIDPNWNLPRPKAEKDSHVRWLADSIKAKGVQQPLTIRNPRNTNGQLIITDGECRMLAVALARSEGAVIRTVPVQVEEDHASEGDRIVGFFTRSGGLPHTPLAKAEALKRLLGYGWSKEACARETGLGIGQVGNLLKLSSLGPDLTNPVQEGKISATLVVEEVRKRGQEGARSSITEAIQRAEGEGRKRATKKHLPPEEKDPELPLKTAAYWERWAKIFLEALEGLVNSPANSWNSKLATAKEVLASFRDGK